MRMLISLSGRITTQPPPTVASSAAAETQPTASHLSAPDADLHACLTARRKADRRAFKYLQPDFCF